MATTKPPDVDDDVRRLHELGYAQELNRGLGTFSNFAISFSIISILAGAVTGFSIGMNAGGPRTIMISWIVVGLAALAVGASMGEICSRYPTAGGLYYWSAKLAKRNGPFWSFFTGWFNLIGQIGVIASVDFALATMTVYFLNTFTDAIDPTNRWHVFATYLLILAAHGLLNTFSVNLVRVLGDISVWWHVVGVAVIFVVLFAAPDNPGGLSILSEGANRTGWTGGANVTLYVAVMGLLFAQYTITGFDASAHVSEETVGAAVGAPKAIVRSIYISAIAAFVMNLAMLYALPDGALDNSGPNMATSGASLWDTIAGNGINASSALFIETAGRGLGRMLIFICLVGQFFCGLASVTANSRMIYAFARDDALPGSRLWHAINPRTRTPTNSVWLGVVASAIVGAISLLQADVGGAGVAVAFFALTGICVIGLYISYVIPVFLRLTNGEFTPGPWNLGRWSRPVGWFSVAWVGFVTVLFFAPLYYPFWPPWEKDPELGALNLANFNFTGWLIVASAVLISLYWNLSAKKWFKGPQVQGTPEELQAIEHELSSLG